MCSIYMRMNALCVFSIVCDCACLILLLSLSPLLSLSSQSHRLFCHLSIFVSLSVSVLPSPTCPQLSCCPSWCGLSAPPGGVYDRLQAERSVACSGSLSLLWVDPTLFRVGLRAWSVPPPPPYIHFGESVGLQNQGLCWDRAFYPVACLSSSAPFSLCFQLCSVSA